MSSRSPTLLQSTVEIPEREKRKEQQATIHTLVLNMEGQEKVQVHVEQALDYLEELQVVTFNNKTRETLLEFLDPTSTSDAIKQKWVDIYDNIDNGFLSGTNSSMSSKSLWPTQAMQARQRIDWEGRHRSIKPSLNDSAVQRKRWATSLARLDRTTDGSKIQNWQKRISTSTLLLAWYNLCLMGRHAKRSRSEPLAILVVEVFDLRPEPYGNS